jgi:D-alanyl-D-alanine carboxypeptidase
MRSVQMPAKQQPKKPVFSVKFAIIFFVLAVVLFIILPRLHESSGSASKSSKNFNTHQYSLDESSSKWAIVNKGRSLPSSYTPPDLAAPNVPLRLPSSDPEMQVRSQVSPAMQKMFEDAKKQNIHLMLSSGYRSYVLQQSVYGSNVNADGQQNADVSSAKPGHSEHQTGLAADIEPTSRNCEVQLCFAGTPEGRWLADNSYKYGFIIRYQHGKEKLTGYEYEPWHVRYVGLDLARQIHATDKTLEQFFNLPTFTDYVKNPYVLK